MTLKEDTEVVVISESWEEHERVVLKNETGIVGLAVTEASSPIQKAKQEYWRTSSWAVPYEKIEQHEKENYVTQDECRELFTQVITEIGLPLDFVEDITARYVKRHIGVKRDTLVETKHISCGGTVVAYVVKYYKINSFSDFIYMMFKRRHGTQENMFFPRIATKFFSLPSNYTNKLDEFSRYPENKWREALKKIKSKLRFSIIRI